MSRKNFATWLVGCSLVAHAGSVVGTVRDTDGVAVPGAQIELRHAHTGKVYSAVSSSTGKFAVAHLPDGRYDLSAFVPGFAFRPYGQKDVAVNDRYTPVIDVTLPFWVTLNTLGDDPTPLLADLRKKNPPSSHPAPRTPDGKPDLSGFWVPNREPAPQPVQLPWAAEQSRQRFENDFRDVPSLHCLPGDPAMPLAGIFPYKLVQTSSLLLILNDQDVAGVQQVFLDGRQHPEEINPTWLGHSTAKWDGDTLVVDTVGFNDRSWLGLMHPHTEMLHVTMRISRPSLGRLETETIVEDPGSLSEPWKVNQSATLGPNEEIMEYVCAENNKDIHHIRVQ
jgi:hypothetical protein